jgi:hypothetical protein
MKKLLIILFLFAPLLANAQNWFKANALYTGVDNKNSTWQKCNIIVCLGDDRKVTIYAQETHTIRALSKTEEYADKSGVSGMFWQAVDENGDKCIVNIQSDQKSYIHLILTFIDDNFVICYNLIPDN